MGFCSKRRKLFEEQAYTNDLTRATIISTEATAWYGKGHAKLLRDIRDYISQLGEAKIGFTEFFKESTYITERNKTLQWKL